MIKVQREDFDIGLELAKLTKNNHKVGGLTSFVGLVRDIAAAATRGDSSEDALAHGRG